MSYVQASTGFIINYNGREEQVVQGEVFDAGHEIVRANPSFFEPMKVRFAAAPEEATARRKRTTKAAEDAADQE